MRMRFGLMTLLAALSLVSGCSRGDGNARDSATAGTEQRGIASAGEFTFSGSHPIQAVCTTGMVADLVRNIGGERVEVVQLMGEGVDPHLYRPSPDDVSRLSRADIIFYSGLHLEGQFAAVLSRLAKSKPTFPVTAGIQEEKLLEVADGYFDPHVWFDVSLWSEAAEYVGNALAEFDAANAGEYRERTREYRQRLAELHDEVKTRIAAIPGDRRVLVTAHDAFHYFGRAYEMEVVAIQGVSTESEASVRKINELVDLVVTRKIPAVFVESSVSERSMQALIDGCAARGHEVRQGGELFSDAMGAPGTPEGTYEGMVRHNVQTIVEALR